MTDEAEERFCCDCANLLGKRERREDAANWKCLAKENVIKRGRNPVTSEHTYDLRFVNCFQTRSGQVFKELNGSLTSGCGPAGAWFIEYKAPEYTPPRKPSNGSKPSGDDLLKALE